MYFFLAETFMPLEINPKRSSVRAFSIMSVLSSDSGLVMPTVYEATWPSATKLWTYTEQRKNSDFANLFLTLLFINRKTLTHVLECHQMKIFRWARTWTLTSNRFFRCISTYWDISFVSKCLPTDCVNRLDMRNHQVPSKIYHTYKKYLSKPGYFWWFLSLGAEFTY